MADRPTDPQGPLPSQGVPPSPRPGQPARADEGLDDDDRPVTRRELLALQTDFNQRAKRAQGAADSVERRVLSRLRTGLANVDPLTKELQEIGVTLSPEQVNALRQSRMQRAFVEEEAEPAQPGLRGNGDGASSPRGNEPVNPVAAAADAAWSIMTEEFGVVVEQGDEEMSLINLRTNKPSVFLASVRDAAEAKAKRMGLAAEGEEGDDEEPPQPRPRSKARAGSGRRTAPAPSSFEGRDAMDLFREGYSKTST